MPEVPVLGPVEASSAVEIGEPTRAALHSRNEFSRLQGLLALSILMTARSEQTEILALACTAVPSLAHCRLVGASVAGIGRWVPDGVEATSLRTIADLLGEQRGDFEILVDCAQWVYALELRSIEGSFGHLVVAADVEPPENERFVLHALAQQTAMALANARLHKREREQAAELQAANDTLADSLAALERSTAIHARLTAVAAAGDGQQAIADAVHELTWLPVAVEDRHGNLRAWAGENRPDPYPKDSPGARAAMLERTIHAVAPLREHGRIVAIAQPATGILGVIALVDPDEHAGPSELIALEHGATVLAIDLARVQAVAETELRLGRDLVDDLIAGHAEEESLRHAHALGYDLERPLRVVVVHRGEGRADDGFFHAVRRAARDEAIGTLLAARSDAVIVIGRADGDWTRFLRAIDAELASSSCRVGVGGICTRPADFPRSYREGRVVVRMQESTDEGRIGVFDELGVYRLLADVSDPRHVERFVRDSLGDLLEYDARRGTDLLHTLSAFFRFGGNYAATSAALHLHRSTLKYRLKRIREISGHDLSDAETQFNLQLAIRAWLTLDALRALDP